MIKFVTSCQMLLILLITCCVDKASYETVFLFTKTYHLVSCDFMEVLKSRRDEKTYVKDKIFTRKIVTFWKDKGYCYQTTPHPPDNIF